MSAPGLLRIKRKRNDDAPGQLVVERAGKRQRDEDYIDEGPVHYVLQKSAQNVESQPALVRNADTQKSRPQAAREKPSGTRSSRLNGERWVFELKRPSTPDGIKKRKGKGIHIPTLVEKKVKRNPQELLDYAESGRSAREASTPAPERPLKRPGKSSAMKQPQSAVTSPKKGHLEAMARSMQLLAEEEAEKEITPKPKLISVPKLSPSRSRDLHRQRVSNASPKAPEKRNQDEDEDVDMDADDDADYVYETYVLAPSSADGAVQVDAQEASGEVGYLIITEEDQAVWESYIEEEPSDKDCDTDEDDENAEDWYGADYPDEELASDDEQNRNAYGYRAGGSDDEEWDEDTGDFSDEEFERQMQPWRKKTPQQFAKYFESVRVENDQDDDEE